MSKITVELEDGTNDLCLMIQDLPGQNRVRTFEKEFVQKNGFILMIEPTATAMNNFRKNVLACFQSMTTRRLIRPSTPICLVFTKADTLHVGTSYRKLHHGMNQLRREFVNLGFRNVKTFVVSSLTTPTGYSFGARDSVLSSSEEDVAVGGVKSIMVWLTHLLFPTADARVIKVDGELYEKGQKIDENDEFLPLE